MFLSFVFVYDMDHFKVAGKLRFDDDFALKLNILACEFVEILTVLTVNIIFDEVYFMQ